MTDRHQRTAYPLRLPDDVREELQKSADEIGRSLNAEIVARLKRTIDQDNPKMWPLSDLIDPQRAHLRTLETSEIPNPDRYILEAIKDDIAKLQAAMERAIPADNKTKSSDS
jgi:hypothetical protein